MCVTTIIRRDHMVDYREILRLASLKYSQRMIESSAGSSRHAMPRRAAM